MLPQRASSSSLIQICILCFVSIWSNVNTVEASVFCSREIYGIPKYSDCQHALLAVPGEEVIHYFVEQQLRAGWSRKDWPSFDDPRRDPNKQKVVQVPKLWNAGGCIRSAWRRPIANEYQGGCNVALLSYVHDGRSVPISSTEWSYILAMGLETLMTCLLSHNQGGAGVVNSKLHSNSTVEDCARH